jgi:adenylosuccinate synthase
MANLIVVGMQWGDEGKGKIVDLLCPAFDVVARYQGGHNAGHTVKFGDRHFSLHLIPSGILHPGALCVLGNGMVIDPEAFLAELGRLEGMGVRSHGRLFVSDRAHLILPSLAELDRAREAGSGARKIGTTGRGIGLAYEAKAGRVGLRVADLYDDRIEDRLRAQIERLRPELEALAGSEKREQPSLPSLDELGVRCRGWAEKFAPFVRDTASLLEGWRKEGKSVLCEGAQGALLDLDHGTYPFVTSSNSIAGGACTGLGVPPTFIDGALGVLKAYTTRVGGGPFPTELNDATGEFLRQRGNEFGTTTGRPRRCGWMDLVAARYARLLNGIDVIALTKLDVLDTQEEIQICTGYRHRGKVLTDFPARLDVVENCEPVYRTVKGWNSPTIGVLEFEDLPVEARDYVRLLEDEIGARISLVSTGPRREETIVNEDPLLAELTSGRLAAVLQERGA